MHPTFVDYFLVLLRLAFYSFMHVVEEHLKKFLVSLISIIILVKPSTLLQFPKYLKKKVNRTLPHVYMYAYV